MSKNVLKKRAAAFRRKLRTRAKINGTAECPRLVVFRSLRHISAQAINDKDSKTLFSASDKDINEADRKGKKPVEVAEMVGKLVGAKIKGAGINKVVFDRRSNKYHGRVKALADGAREAGLEF
jgi:large subunit ribosomal protein L18